MTPQQQADSIARKCANDLQKYTGQDQNTNELIAPQLVESAHLVQLWECAEASNTLIGRMSAVYKDPRFVAVWASYANHGGDYSNGPKWTEEFEALQQALTNLDRAMKGEK